MKVSGDNLGRVRRGMILPLMLLILVLLGLMAATSSFYVYANHSATQSLAQAQQARLAAEAGIQKVMHLLRTERNNVDAWYHNPAEFHRVIVWSDDGGLESLGTVDEYVDVSPVYRFSIVADNPNDDETLVRYGITDEASKLNINTATREQLVALIGQFTTEEMNVDELVDALLDWRDEDTRAHSFGVESEFYAQLDPPYAVKNAPFDTVEELLLVRGFTGELLYGEDFDRNGLMSPNEDDGDERFPPDDADGILNRGLYPYLTVYSRDINSASDNQPRVFLFGDANAVSEALVDYVDTQAKLDFIAGAGQGQPRITSPAQLLLPRTQKRTSAPPGSNAPNDGTQGESGNGQPQESATEQIPSPVTLDDMRWVMDRCTTSMHPEFIGLININTAPAQVLATLPMLDEEDIATIIETRAELPSDDKRSVGWVAPLVGAEKFAAIAPYLTARAMRFRVQSLGYGDHMGTIVRLEVVIEMRGPIAQVIYNRDLTSLGTDFPIRYAEGDSELVGFDR